MSRSRNAGAAGGTHYLWMVIARRHSTSSRRAIVAAYLIFVAVAPRDDWVRSDCRSLRAGGTLKWGSPGIWGDTWRFADGFLVVTGLDTFVVATLFYQHRSATSLRRGAQRLPATHGEGGALVLAFLAAFVIVALAWNLRRNRPPRGTGREKPPTTGSGLSGSPPRSLSIRPLVARRLQPPDAGNAAPVRRTLLALAYAASHCMEKAPGDS